MTLQTRGKAGVLSSQMRNVDQLKTAPCNFIFLREKYASDIFHPTTSFFTRPCFAHDLIVFFFFAPLLRMIFSSLLHRTSISIFSRLELQRSILRRHLSSFFKWAAFRFSCFIFRTFSFVHLRIALLCKRFFSLLTTAKCLQHVYIATWFDFSECGHKQQEYTKMPAYSQNSGRNPEARHVLKGNPTIRKQGK